MASPSWCNEDFVQRMLLSNHFIFDFLKNQKFKRKKISREEKVVPPQAVVRQIMGIGYEMIRSVMISRGLSATDVLDYIWNMDETAFTWAIAPTHMFVAQHTSRASFKKSDLYMGKVALY